METRSKSPSIIGLRIAALALAAVGMASAADLPTAKQVAQDMGVAWNNGNSLEVPKDPLAWGNPLPTQKLIDQVKASGFKTVRLPCAWDSHADASTNVINAAWLAQVKTIVDYCIRNGMYVVLNSHWDGGWLEEKINTASQTEVNRKQKAYWTQIANHFKDYDHHLLFAGANEPAVQDAYGVAFGADRVAVLNSYLQTFIDAVRATGGNNATRTLIVQAPRSDIELGKSAWTTLPKDPTTSGRLMAEFHFYPYQWALMENDETWGKVYYYWGKANMSTTDTERNTGWCNEAFVDSQFHILKRLYVDKGIPVLLGEWGAVKRMTLSGAALDRHLQSRRTYYQYVVSAARSRGIVPAVWDAGFTTNLNMTIFNRPGATVYDQSLVDAIMAGARTSFYGTVSVQPRPATASEGVRVSRSGDALRAVWTGASSGSARASLVDAGGRILWTESVQAVEGENALAIPLSPSGIAFLRVDHGGRTLVGTVPGD